jgi:hypothetical protein
MDMKARDSHQNMRGSVLAARLPNKDGIPKKDIGQERDRSF